VVDELPDYVVSLRPRRHFAISRKLKVEFDERRKVESIQTEAHDDDHGHSNHYIADSTPNEPNLPVR
jgi:hypothetical protein